MVLRRTRLHSAQCLLKPPKGNRSLFLRQVNYVSRLSTGLASFAGFSNYCLFYSVFHAASYKTFERKCPNQPHLILICHLWSTHVLHNKSIKVLNLVRPTTIINPSFILLPLISLIAFLPSFANRFFHYFHLIAPTS